MPEGATALSPEFREYSTTGDYYPTPAGLVVITYNTNLVKPDEVPKNWTDFLNPKLNGKVSLAHPVFSGCVGTWVLWVLEMRKLYGWGFFKKLEKNKPLIGQSVKDTVTMLNSGERQIAAGSDLTTLESAARGNPVGVAYPVDRSLLLIGPSARSRSCARRVRRSSTGCRRSSRTGAISSETKPA